VDRALKAIALLCRTSDRTSGGARGALALAEALGDHRVIGSPGEPRPDGQWDEDLRDSRGCILEAGGQVDDALEAGAFPVLAASDCTICLTTFAAVLRHEPEARFLWLDAHGDFNTPNTTPSGFLGGMCLAAACGRWDAGFPGVVDPTRVVMCGVRDLDAGEQVEVERAGVVSLERPSAVPEALGDHPVYVHLDLDVLDPDIFPAQFPVPHGLSDTGLRTLLGEVAQGRHIIGIEVTAFEAPEDSDERERLADLVADAISPLLFAE
jgi:arginase